MFSYHMKCAVGESLNFNGSAQRAMAVVSLAVALAAAPAELPAGEVQAPAPAAPTRLTLVLEASTDGRTWFEVARKSGALAGNTYHFAPTEMLVGWLRVRAEGGSGEVTWCADGPVTRMRP